jgi:hypothetical protein
MSGVQRSDGADKATRGYIIGLTRQLQKLLPIDPHVVGRIERTAKVGSLSADDAAVLIAVLRTYIDRLTREQAKL